MAVRLGIATDLEVRKWELEQQFKNTRGWRSTTAFETKKEAEVWAESKSIELKCKLVPAGKQGKRKPIKWYGFIFEHDGPK